MTLLKLMKERYSARSYSAKKIDRDILEAILEAGRVAPTAANRQTQKILVIESEEGLKKIASACKAYNPPTILVICSEKSKSWVSPFDGKTMNDIDCSIVSTHMMLEAKAQGVDSLWLNWFDPEVLYSELNIPKEYEIVNLFALGYSDTEAASADRHDKTRKPISETVFYESFN